MTQNRGFIPDPPEEQDWEFGGLTGITDEILQPDGQWDAFLPVFELQRNYRFDSYSCVAFARNNCLETIHKRKYEVEENYSDRFASVMTDTVPRKGNSLKGGGDKARKTGSVSELVYPSITPEMTEQQFFLQPSQDIKAIGLAWLKDYSINYDWVSKTGGSKFNIVKAKEALKRGPLQTAIDASTKKTSQFNGWNDSVMIYGYEEGKCWKVFGSYPETTGNFDWDYPFFNPLRWHLEKLTINQIDPNMKSSLIRNMESGEIYLLDSSGIKHHVVSPETFVAIFGQPAWDEKDWNETEGAVCRMIPNGVDITIPLAPGLRQIIDAFISTVKKLGNKLGLKN